jgi:hypothetical protein
MAVAGILLGTFFPIGILVAYLVTPPPVPLGSTVNVSHRGIRSMRVISVEFPVSEDGHLNPTSGTEYAVAHVRICAGDQDPKPMSLHRFNCTPRMDKSLFLTSLSTPRSQPFRQMVFAATPVRMAI